MNAGIAKVAVVEMRELLAGVGMLAEVPMMRDGCEPNLGQRLVWVARTRLC